MSPALPTCDPIGKGTQLRAKLKLDLHTHCGEAAKCSMANEDVARKIVGRIKARGLDGIAITDHYDKYFAFRIRDIVHRLWGSSVIIIPGQEIEAGPVDIVELYLDGHTTFRFVAHPGCPADFVNNISDVHGLEVENAVHNFHMDKQRIKDIAERHGLLLLSNSDAHTLNDIGVIYNEISLQELINRATHR